jgi:hypothetical protein
VRTQHVPFELSEEVAEEVDQACHQEDLDP